MTFEGGPNGGIEDFNMIYDHDLYKNTPANDNGKFHNRCPHVCGAVLNHLEETVAQSEKEDTAFGMARFIHGCFPMVANKIRPEGGNANIAAHVADEAYFNDLTYDQCVQCMAHVMLVAWRLFPYGQDRDDAAENPGCYSKLLGVHSLPWEAAVLAVFSNDFTKFVDEIRADQLGSGAKMSQINKEKTRPLQFMAPADVFEKVLDYLLSKSSKKDELRQNLTGEDIVIAIADVDIFQILKVMTPKAIEPKLCAASVRVALKLASWFQRNYDLIMGMKNVVQDLKTTRSTLSLLPFTTPEEAVKLLGNDTRVHVNVSETLHQVYRNFDFKAFCMDPFNSEAEISAMKFDLIVLAMMGFIVVVDGRFKAVTLERDDEDGVRAWNRLTAWDSSVDLETAATWLDERTPTVPKVALRQDDADQVVQAIKRLLDGGAATVEHLPCPIAPSALPAGLPLTQRSNAGARVPQHAAESSQVVGRAALTQDRPSEGEDVVHAEDESSSDHGPQPKRLRQEEELTPEHWKDHGVFLGKMVTYIVCAETNIGTQRRLLKQKWKADVSVKTLDKLITCAFRLLEDMGLASRTGRGGSIELYAPPESMFDGVVSAMVTILGESDKTTIRMRDALKGRDENQYFDQAHFDAAVAMVGDTIKAP